MYQLHIANRNYSSWSLRPWLLMTELGIAFEEVLSPFGEGDFRSFSPTGKVPCLHDRDTTPTTVVWDSLAITEFLAERHPEVWPADPIARAWARSACAEMHAGFGALRETCTMNCGLRIRLHHWPHTVLADWQRAEALWAEGLQRFGGPFLAGNRFTAVDAFFAPLAFRAQTYSPELGLTGRAFVQHMLARPAMRQWETWALAEVWRDEPHEADARDKGTWLQDLRQSNAGNQPHEVGSAPKG
jgi:glutathione S-transferase